MSEMPSLPQVGDPNWGPQLNECMVWLYEQMVNNNLLILELQAQVAALQSRPDYTYSYAPWTYSNNAPPATANQVRLNDTLPAATLIDIRKIDSDSNDRTSWFNLLSTESFVRLSDWDNSAIYHRYKVTGPVTFGATNAQIPVTWIEGSGVLPNAKAEVAFLIDVSHLHGV